MTPKPAALLLLLALPAGALEFKSGLVKVNDVAGVQGRPADPREAELAELAARHGVYVARMPVEPYVVYELFTPEGDRVGTIRLDDKGTGAAMRRAVEGRLQELGLEELEQPAATPLKPMTRGVADQIAALEGPKPECTDQLARNRCHGPVGKWDGCVDLFLKVWSKGRSTGQECRPKAAPAAEQS